MELSHIEKIKTSGRFQNKNITALTIYIWQANNVCNVAVLQQRERDDHLGVLEVWSVEWSVTRSVCGDMRRSDSELTSDNLSDPTYTCHTVAINNYEPHEQPTTINPRPQ